jgi:hypothetical protein
LNATVGIERQIGIHGLHAASFGHGHRLIVRRQDGGQLAFDQAVFPKLPELKRLSERDSLPYFVPPVLEACQAGEVVSFGKVSASCDGLHSARGTLP